MPIGADLVLHERPNPDAVVWDGRALGQVVEETARRYRTPLAFAHTDLQLDKTALLELLGVPAAEIPFYHFSAEPGAGATARVATGLRGAMNFALRAHIDSVEYIAAKTDLVPIRMTIDPLSLMTKLLKDPITPLYLAGSGVTAAEEPEVALLERALELIFHCCGELNDYMIRQFCALEPVILSLGSSRKLWEDAAIVSKDIVLYGDLPSKHFYSDAVITVEQVEAQACDLLSRMAQTGHPFILGSECDILHVAGGGETIRKKAEAFVRCRCDGAQPIR
jgi:hypothetical protein